MAAATTSSPNTSPHLPNHTSRTRRPALRFSQLTPAIHRVSLPARPYATGAKDNLGGYRSRATPHPDPHHRKPAPTAPAVPKPRTISRALLTHPDHLTEDDAQILKNATAACAHLEHLQQHVRTFAKIMAHRRGRELPAWLDAVEADDLPELRSLAAGIRRDLTAVVNGFTLEHSSGAVEGNVTRVKRIKRDGYGRANFDLLRAQILVAA